MAKCAIVKKAPGSLVLESPFQPNKQVANACWRYEEIKMNTGMNLLTIPYPKDLLLSLKESKSDFEAEAKLLLAVKLYEMGRVSTGMAARVAGMDRVSFIFVLDRFGLSPIGVDADELEQDLANA